MEAMYCFFKPLGAPSSVLLIQARLTLIDLVLHVDIWKLPRTASVLSAGR